MNQDIKQPMISFSPAKPLMIAQLLMGFFMFTVAMTTGEMLFLACAVMFFIAGIINATFTVISIYDQHLEFKPAPIRAKKFINFSDLSSIAVIKKRIILQVKEGDTVTEHKIALGIFSKADQEKLLDSLNKIIEFNH